MSSAGGTRWRALLGSGAGKVAVAMLDQAVVSGTSFVTSVVIGRVCLPEGLGVYALALSVLLLLRGVQAELVCSPYLVYCQRRAGGELASYTGSTLVHYLLLSAGSVAVLAALGSALALGLGPQDLAHATWALAGAAPFLLLREYVRQVSFAQVRPAAALAIDASVGLLQVGGLVLLGWLGWLSVVTAYAVAGAACAAACLGWLAARRGGLKVVPQALGPDWRHNWSFARWALASFLVGNLAPLLVPWVVAATHGKAAAGLLAACATLANCLHMYVAGLNNLLTPRAAGAYARGGPDELRRVLLESVALVALPLAPAFLFVLATGDLSATLVYGAGYAGSGAVLAVLALHVLVAGLGQAAGNGLWALERPEANLAADVCALGTTALTLALLARPLGVLGAAVATLAGGLVGVTVRGLRLGRFMAEARAAEAAEGRAA